MDDNFAADVVHVAVIYCMFHVRLVSTEVLGMDCRMFIIGFLVMLQIPTCDCGTYVSIQGSCEPKYNMRVINSWHFFPEWIQPGIYEDKWGEQQLI